jgi:hypothetical protein
MRRIFCLSLIGIFAIQVAAQPAHTLNHSLAVYAAITGKTILQPCQLPQLQDSSFSEFPTNKPEAIIFIEQEFNKFGYELVPAGEKFVMVIQAQTRTNTLVAAQLSRFQPPALNTNSPAGAGTLNFQNASVSQVLEIYSTLRRCQIIQPASLPSVCITLRTQQSLTREEVIYALNITMVLNGIVAIDDGGKNVLVVPLDKASLEKFGSSGK